MPKRVLFSSGSGNKSWEENPAMTTRREHVVQILEALKSLHRKDEVISDALERAIFMIEEPEGLYTDPHGLPSPELLPDRHLVIDATPAEHIPIPETTDSVYGDLMPAFLDLTIFDWQWVAIREHLDAQFKEGQHSDDVIPRLKLPVEVQIRVEWTEHKDEDDFRRWKDLVPELATTVETAVDPNPDDGLQRIYYLRPE